MGTPRTTPRLIRNAAAGLLVALAAAAAFSPSLGNGFVILDDTEMILRPAPLMSGGLVAAVRWAFTSTLACNWYPVTRVSHIFDMRVFGVDATGHHAVGLLLHAVNACLLFAALRQLTGASARSLLVALLFAVHPLQAETVCWAAERSNILAALLWIATAATHVWYTRRPGTARYLLVVASFGAGLMTKPILVTLPVTLLILDWWPLGRLHGATGDGAWRHLEPARVRGAILEKTPLLALSAAAGALFLRVQSSCDAVRTLGEVSFAARLKNLPRNYLAYLGKSFWPADLGPFYPHPGDALALSAALAAAALLAAITALTLREAARRPHLAAGWAWFLVVLAPVTGIVQTGDKPFADSYAYVSLVGIMLALAWSLPRCSAASCRRLVLIACTAVVAALALLARRQAGAWRDTETLASFVLARHPGNIAALDTLGNMYYQRGDFEAAARQALELVRREPRRGIIRANLAQVLEARGELEAAVHHLRAAVRFSPLEREYRDRLARLEARHSAAVTDAASFRARLAVDPLDPEALRELGAALYELGRFDEAAAPLEQALATQPNQPDVSRLLEAIGHHRPDGGEAAVRAADIAAGLP